MLFSKQEYDALGEDFYRALYGRVLAEDVIDERGNVILAKGELMLKENVNLVESLAIEQLYVRTPLVCTTISGVCQHCYGMDLATRKIVDV
jgi:DNA-directed RNA polymerase subunit beta'